MSEDSESALSRLKSSWDANADLWTDAVRSAAIPSRGAGTDQAVVDAIVQTEPTSLIDIGCGEGWLVRRLRQQIDCTLVGFDASPLLIQQARQADPEGLYAVLTYEQMLELSTDMPRSFDTAVCNFSLFHEDLSPTLCRIQQLLRDSGSLVIQTLHPWNGARNQAYQDAWLEETFSSLPSPAQSKAWQAMPWYFRTLASWIQQISDAGMFVRTIHEPLDKSSAQPLSMVLTCQKLLHAGQAKTADNRSRLD